MFHEIIALIVLILFILAAFILVFFGMPGTFLILIGALIYNLITWSWSIGWTALIILLVLALLGELFDVVASAVTARHFGSSWVGVFGAVLGGIAGTVIGVPVPVLGSVLGLFIGAFVGATLFELVRQRSVRKGLRAGVGAFVGRITSIFVKLALAVMMLFVAIGGVVY